MGIYIKSAARDEIYEIAEFLDNCWKAAYSGIIDADFLKKLSVDERCKGLLNCFDGGVSDFLVMRDGEKLIGASVFGQSFTDGYPDDGEVSAIYIHNDYIGKGYGHALLAKIETGLAAKGYTNFVLDVLTENTRSVSFYQRHDYESVSENSIELGEKTYPLTVFRKKNPLVIRMETAADFSEVYNLVKTSFATALHGDGTEADYLNDVRKKDAFIPDLSLVAVMDKKIVGQIVLYKTVITTETGDITELLLSPICVHPDYFRRGIARAMIETAISKATNMGFSAVFLCGNPDIYKKLGFAPTYKYNVYHVDDKHAEWSMVRELFEGALKSISGTINTN